jgi:pimeloyl-ACP methyl ester carboxylesterase
MAPMLLAVEPRLSLGLLLVGGFYLQAALPEADVINFAPRVKVPVLMLNGRYDFFFPTEQAQEPMFAMLGTPPADKRHVLFDTAHNIPRNDLVRESVDWMEKYWGPVNPHR